MVFQLDDEYNSQHWLELNAVELHFEINSALIVLS
jgi:hypothetical protein